MIEYPKYKKVLFCTDFSSHSDIAFDYAFGIAKRDGGILYILHVIPENPDHYNLERCLSRAELARIKATLAADREKMYNDRYLSQIKDKTNVRVVTESGREDRKILDFVRKEGVDIVVIGTRGRTGVERFFLGSVAEKVIRHSPVPVLIIPGRKNPDRGKTR